MRRIGIVLHSKAGDLSRRLFSGDNYIILAALIFTLLIRLLTVQMIDDAGDSKMYMDHVRQLVIDPSGYSFDHWSARFAVIVPVYLVRLATGGLAAGAYVLPVFLSLVMVFFMMKTSRLLGRIEAGFLAAIIIGVYPAMVREGSQILPGIFSMAYLMGAFYFLALFLHRERRGLLPVFLSALMMFFAYGTHIINIFFAPGMVFLLFLGRKRRFASIMGYSATLLALYLAETSLYHFFTSYSLGHLDIIRSSHLAGNASLKALAVWELFMRLVLPGPFFVLLLAASIWYCVICIRGRDQVCLHPFIPAASFLFFMVFSVKSINPLIPALPLNSRYLDPSVPFLVLFCSFFLLSGLESRFDMVRIRRWLLYAGMMLLVAGTLIFHRSILSNEILGAHRADRLIDSAIEKGLPLVYGPEDSLTGDLAVKYMGQGFRRIRYKTDDPRSAILDEYGKMEKNLKYLNAFFVREPLRVNLEVVYPSPGLPVLMCVRSDSGIKPDMKKYFSGEDNSLMLLERRPLRVREISVKEYRERQRAFFKEASLSSGSGVQ
jgi:hypothetical protein